ncbi:MAG: VWA domain-containing protein [Saprospiraceae bacterium]|nr:VWA domain-containing protein [Saprospiraceae bacterium]
MHLDKAANYNSLSEAIVGFSQYLRLEGLNVGIKECHEALLAAQIGTIDDPKVFGYALKSIFCSSQEEGALFDLLFRRFWLKEAIIAGKTNYKNQTNIQKQSPASLVWMGVGEQQEEQKEEEGQNVSGANAIERLRKTDFSKISDMDSTLVEELAMQLWQQMAKRLKRKLKQSQSKGAIDLRKTIRKSIGNGGDPIRLIRKNKIPRKQRLVILLDVSGSMDKYSFFLLRFVCALRTYFETVEAFLFSTNLIRITDYLDATDLGLTLQLLSAKAHHWSSGTKIGDCFQTFNEHYAKQVLVGQSTTIVLSDGLDTGDIDVLVEELGKIKRRTRRLIWLNPLKGMEGYEPTQRAMSAALPALDVFHSAHNLNSLLELENYLLHV